MSSILFSSSSIKFLNDRASGFARHSPHLGLSNKLLLGLPILFLQCFIDTLGGMWCATFIQSFIHSFFIRSFLRSFLPSFLPCLSYYRSIAFSKASSPRSAICVFSVSFQYPVFSLRLPSSCLCLIIRLLVTSLRLSVFSSKTWFRRKLYDRKLTHFFIR